MKERQNKSEKKSIFLLFTSKILRYFPLKLKWLINCTYITFFCETEMILGKKCPGSLIHTMKGRPEVVKL